MNSFNNNDYIDILEIVKKVWNYKFPVIALAVVFALLCAIRVEFFVDDQYVSSGILYVTTRKDDSENEKAISQGDISTAKTFSNTYREILKTRSFLAEVEKDIEGKTESKYSWRQLKSMFSVSAVNNTELMQISVTSTNRNDAFTIADSIVNLSPEKLGEIYGTGSVKIVDDALPPSGAVSKGTMSQAVKGGAVGMIIGLAIVVVIGLFDKKIHKSEDVSKRYNISILGEVAQ